MPRQAEARESRSISWQDTASPGRETGARETAKERQRGTEQTWSQTACQHDRCSGQKASQQFSTLTGFPNFLLLQQIEGISAQRSLRKVRLLLFGADHYEVDESGAHYELTRRCCAASPSSLFASSTNCKRLSPRNAQRLYAGENMAFDHHQQPHTPRSHLLQRQLPHLCDQLRCNFCGTTCSKPLRHPQSWCLRASETVLILSFLRTP